MEPKAPTRRDVLRQAGLVPVVYGLAALGCRAAPRSGESDDASGVPPAEPWSIKEGPPRAWTSAIAEMKGLDRAGVAIRIPKDAAVGKALGTNLVDLCARGTLDQRLLFAEAVFVCLTSAQIEALLEGARPDDDAILFEHGSGDGKPRREGGAAIPAADAADRARLGETLRSLVEGPNGERLAALAEARRKAATKEEWAAYEAFEPDPLVGVAWTFPRGLVPVLLADRRAADPARRARAVRALEPGLAASRPGHLPLSAEPPYGVAMASKGGGCSGAGPNVDCGMALPTPSSYRFLHYLTSNV